MRTRQAAHVYLVDFGLSRQSIASPRRGDREVSAPAFRARANRVACTLLFDLARWAPLCPEIPFIVEDMRAAAKSAGTELTGRLIAFQCEARRGDAEFSLACTTHPELPEVSTIEQLRGEAPYLDQQQMNPKHVGATLAVELQEQHST